MKESFLHLLWSRKMFSLQDLKTYHGSTLEIIQFGKINPDAGPDFYQAEIIIGQQLWVGCVEMHVNSSDWEVHQHSNDPAYKNVILHVVWNHDQEITALRSRNVETLILSHYVPKEVFFNYENLIQQSQKPLPCYGLTNEINWDKIQMWFNRLLIDRLEEKANQIYKLLQHNNGNWEETTFKLLASNFGLKVNEEAFQIWSNSFPFSVLQKIQAHPLKVEALFFGQAGFLENPMDFYTVELKKEYDFIRHKYHLNPIDSSIFKFSTLRPIGFPTVRLAQLSALYGQFLQVFSNLIQFKKRQEIEIFFQSISLPTYWDTHYVLGKESKFLAKKIAISKIHNLIVNTILPLKIAYDKMLDQFVVDDYEEILSQIKEEKNSIVDMYKDARFPIHNAKDSQVILHLKKRFCDQKKCLNCAIGTEVLKS